MSCSFQAHSKPSITISISPHECMMCICVHDSQILLWVVERLSCRFPLLSFFLKQQKPAPVFLDFIDFIQNHWISYKSPAPNSLFLQLGAPSHSLSRNTSWSRINKQQTWLLAASCVPPWCRTAAKEFLVISLPRAWEKNLICRCLPSNADLLGREDLLKHSEVMNYVSETIRHRQTTYVTSNCQLKFL